MISPTHTISPEWLNENALRGYPLMDDCKAAEVIPTWLIADLHITVPVSYIKAFVSSVYISDALLSVAISGEKSDGTVVGLLTKTVARDTVESYKLYSLDRITDATGVIAFGEPDDGITNLNLTFTPDDAQLVPSCITRVVPPGVTKLTCPAFGTSADGIIDLSGNSEFRTYVDPDDPQMIVIELTDMYRDLTTSVCTATPSFDKCGETPVKTINGVGPDSNGVVTLRFV